MEFLFDTVNIPDILQYGKCFPYTGVTSNPSIIKADFIKSGVKSKAMKSETMKSEAMKSEAVKAKVNIDFFGHFREIRRVIGDERSLHIQILAQDCDGILAEADAILSNVDELVYIKIPTTMAGLEAMQALKKRGVNVTATAIYSKIQGFMAIAAGADFIAPYYNRMENQDVDSCDTIRTLTSVIDAKGLASKVVAASFKNIAQVNNAIAAGAHSVTVQPALLKEALGMASIAKAVEDFAGDWVDVVGGVGILDL